MDSYVTDGDHFCCQIVANKSYAVVEQWRRPTTQSDRNPLHPIRVQ